MSQANSGCSSKAGSSSKGVVASGSCFSTQETPASHSVQDSELALEDLKYEVSIYLLPGFLLQGGFINLEDKFDDAFLLWLFPVVVGRLRRPVIF